MRHAALSSLFSLLMNILTKWFKGPDHEYKHDAVQDCKDIRLVMEAVCQAVVASPGLRRLAPR